MSAFIYEEYHYNFLLAHIALLASLPRMQEQSGWIWGLQ